MNRPDLQLEPLDMAATSGDEPDGIIHFAGDWSPADIHALTAAWPNVTLYPHDPPSLAWRVLRYVIALWIGFMAGAAAATLVLS